MISHISIRDFQSLARVDMPLAPFTVIVGPSSSGKSAFTRALKTLTSNARGSSFISTWAKTCRIEAEFTDSTPTGSVLRGSVRLTRGSTTESNAYEILPPEDQPNAPESRFTKLGGAVPEEITQFLRIPASSDLHFASQFDKPYLLDASAADVARTLANLTNVHTVFAAAREANRTRLATNATLKTRRSDLEGVQARFPEFKALKGQMAALNDAEDRLAAARDLQARRHTLSLGQAALDSASATIRRTAPLLARPLPHDGLERAESLLRRRTSLASAIARVDASQAVLDRTTPLLGRPVPTMERVEAAYAAVSAWKAALVRLRQAREKVAASADSVALSTTSVSEAESAYIEGLHEIGTCPTCLQDTTGVTEAVLA